MLQWHLIDNETKPKPFVSLQGLGNLEPLGLVSIVLEHKLLSPALPLEKIVPL